MTYREPAPKMCAYPRCSRPADAGPLPGGSPSGDPAFCSWGCWNGNETRRMFLLVKQAKAATLRSRVAAEEPG